MFKLLVFLLLLTVQNSKTDNFLNQNKEKLNYRLPDAVFPKKYTIQLKVYLDENHPKNFSFDGIVDIDIRVKNPVQTITLHNDNLTISSVDLFQNQIPIEPLYIKYERETNFSIIYSTKRIKPADYTLRLKYNGILNDDGYGFYRSFYTNEKDETKCLASTYFEPTNARRAFPCFDEPKFKAIFDISIDHHKNYSALFNTKVKSKSEPDNNGRVKTIFEPTPKMPTYNLAFIISDFLNITNKQNNHTLYATNDRIQDGDFAMKIEHKLFKNIEEYVGIPFELNKLDLAAMPLLPSKAVENWGLITFSEEYLLVRFEESKQYIANTISHEFAHQWFGNLVTHDWWKFLWLTEGFATFFATEINQEIPGLDSPDKKWNERQFIALLSDSFINRSQPIVFDVETPEEIKDMFDYRVYYKAPCIIRMMQKFLTEPIFKKGINYYLKKNKYNTVTSDDLYRAIEEIMKQEKYNLQYDLQSIMDSWINYEGFPIVNVIRDYDKKTVTLEQEKYQRLFDVDQKSRTNHTWYIPINFATRSNPDFQRTTPDFWLKDSILNDSIAADSEDWIILNKQEIGFYKVNYDEKNWKLISDYLKTSDREKIHPINRARLMLNSVEFFEQGLLNFKTLLPLADSLANETDLSIWEDSGFTLLFTINDKLLNTKFYPQFKKKIPDLIQLYLDEASHVPESINPAKRSIYSLACRAGNENILNEMEQKLNLWLVNPSENLPEDKHSVFSCGLMNANFSVWKSVYDKYLGGKDDMQDWTILKGLSTSNEKNHLIFILNESLKIESNSFDRKEVVDYIISNNPGGVDLVLNFLLDNIAGLSKIFNSYQLNRICGSISSNIINEDQFKKLETLMNNNIPKYFLKNAERNIKWLDDSEEAIKDWLK